MSFSVDRLSYLRSRSLPALVAMAVLSFASNASAEGPAAPAPAAAATPSSLTPPATATPAGTPDVVRLRNGGMLRGAISELVPNGDVVLVMITGELRRIPMRDVEYAGPAAAAPGGKANAAATASLDAASPAASPASVPVAVAANEKGVTLHVRGASATGTIVGNHTVRVDLNEYQELCVAPCSSSLTTGGHTLAASLPGGRLVESLQPVDVRGPSKLDIDYSSKRDLRSAGVVTAILGYLAMGIGTYVNVTSDAVDCHFAYGAGASGGCTESDTPKVGLGVAIAGGLVGTVGLLLAILVKDSVEFSIAPQGTIPPSGGGPAGTVSDGSDRKDNGGASHASLHVSRSGIGVTF